MDSPVIAVASESGRTALALSNRRPNAMILAVTRTEAIARTLAGGWGVTPLVLAQDASAEEQLAFAIDWARANRLVKPGQHIVLVRGQVPGEPRSRAVLAREVTEARP